MINKIIAFVPARGGSTRVQKKNLQLIGNLPLFLRSCYNLNQILPKDSIVVDSDDDIILNLAKKHGFKTLKRPDDLATNSTDGNSFFRWETSNFPDYELYIQHLPPMPFLSKNTINKALMLISEGFDSIVPVSREKLYLWDSSTVSPKYDLNNIPNSFTLKDTVSETMGFYMITRQAHLETGRRIGKKYAFLEIPKIENIDIDYFEDLEIARAIENGLSFSSEYKSKNLIYHYMEQKLTKIKTIICDVDGVLTDGKMIYAEDGNELKNFNTKDGIAAMKLKENNFKLIILSSGSNKTLIKNRANHINFDYVDVGIGSKKDRLEKIFFEFNINPEEALYIGDDINDIDAMNICGVKVCPCDAHKSVKDIANIILETSGGNGCLREIADKILKKGIVL